MRVARVVTCRRLVAAADPRTSERRCGTNAEWCWRVSREAYGRLRMWLSVCEWLPSISRGSRSWLKLVVAEPTAMRVSETQRWAAQNVAKSQQSPWQSGRVDLEKNSRNVFL